MFKLFIKSSENEYKNEYKSEGIDAVGDCIIGAGAAVGAVAGALISAPIRVFGHGLTDLFHDCAEMGSAISAARKASKEAKAAQAEED